MITSEKPGISKGLANIVGGAIMLFGLICFGIGTYLTFRGLFW
jgi:hypothetical protein